MPKLKKPQGKSPAEKNTEKKLRRGTPPRALHYKHEELPHDAILDSQKKLPELANDILQEAKKLGASGAEVAIAFGQGFSVNVRMSEVETLSTNRSRSALITVYFGKCKGNASVTDFRKEAISTAVKKACYIARYTNEDPCSGLADPDLMAYNYKDLDLYHPWNISISEAISLAKKCEEEGLSFDKRLVNSEGAGFNTANSVHIYANSYGFLGNVATTSYDISLALVAEENQKMQRMYDYFVSREAIPSLKFSTVAKEAAIKTIKKLGARTLTTRECPVIFLNTEAKSLFSAFISAISGSNLYHKASFLLDKLQKPVFSSHVSLLEDPHILKALGSAPFDAEGVRTLPREIVTNGVLNGYVLSSYSARKLKMQTTGNAGGVYNLFVKTTHNISFRDLLQKMGTGLLVTELMGHGVNIVTGDYSRGAFGFWVENGEIQYPVERITIAGSLKDMFLNMIAISNDIEMRGTLHVGSVLVEKMKVGGL